MFVSLLHSELLYISNAPENLVTSWRLILCDTANDAFFETRFLCFKVAVKIVILLPRCSFHDLAVPLKMEKMELNS